MNIISYNINGLNAMINNGKLEQLFIDHPADIYCLQETKADKAKMQLLINCNPKLFKKFKLVHYESNHGKKGYAGVLTLANADIKSCSGVEIKCDDMYSSGRVQLIDLGTCYLVNVYTLNSGNKDEMRKDFDKKFREWLQSLDKPYIVCGDLNVVSGFRDFHGDYEHVINAGPGLMDFEIEGFHKLITENRLYDAFRDKHLEERKYTWYSPRHDSVTEGHGWRLDYFLVSETFKEHVRDCLIHDGYQAPDHCPIEIIIDL